MRAIEITCSHGIAFYAVGSCAKGPRHKIRAVATKSHRHKPAAQESIELQPALILLDFVGGASGIDAQTEASNQDIRQQGGRQSTCAVLGRQIAR